MTDKREDKNRQPDANDKNRPVYTEDQGQEYLDEFLSRSGEKDEKKPAEKKDTKKKAEGGKKGKDDDLKERVKEALCQIYDPEIPVNIYDLGLIYDIETDDNGNVVVTMTLTTPHCPVAETMPGEVEMRVSYVEGVQDATVNLVWDPPWDPSKMSEAAQLELGFL